MLAFKNFFSFIILCFPRNFINQFNTKINTRLATRSLKQKGNLALPLICPVMLSSSPPLWRPQCPRQDSRDHQPALPASHRYEGDQKSEVKVS